MGKKNPYLDVINSNYNSFVEIGGIKWGTCNLGANHPWEPGLYFQWGDTRGYSELDIRNGNKSFDWDSYKFGFNGQNRKYHYDNKSNLDLEDDAVNAVFGGKWRMPTRDEFKKLYESTTFSWICNYQETGASVMVFTDKTDESKNLIMPLQGYAYEQEIRNLGLVGYYWSNTCNVNDFINASNFSFTTATVYWRYLDIRLFGFSVRGVLDC